MSLYVSVQGFSASLKRVFKIRLTLFNRQRTKCVISQKSQRTDWSCTTKKQELHGQEVMSADIAIRKAALDANLKANDALVRHIGRLEDEQKDMRRRTPYEKAKDEFEENKKALNPASDQTDLFEENISRREEGTCRWIFKLEEYKSWHDRAGSSIL